MRDLASGPPSLAQAPAEGFAVLAGESLTPLWPDHDSGERDQQQGKVQNLRLAARALDGRVLSAGAVFSFWRHVGPPIAARGYAQGRMLQQGCMVSSVGGGLCQLSNALYEAALQAGCRIVERHAHSQVVPGSAAALGRDATVAWNYVDLRFVADRDLHLTARLGQGHLVVRLYARETGRRPPSIAHGRVVADLDATIAPRSCASCDEVGCFRHRPAALDKSAAMGPRAFLVDEAWPEFRAYVAAERRPGDSLGRPLDGRRLGLARHAWDSAEFGHVASAPAAALARGLALRHAGDRGALRRAAELEGTNRIAGRLARALTPEITRLVVAQSFLPRLWSDGALGGREVVVLMSRLPMGMLQARLDAAARRHPSRASLADFRASAWMVAAEAEALTQAALVVTPHAEVAELFGDRAVWLPWDAPSGTAEPVWKPIRRIAFAGPTAARKGAFAVREVALALDLEVAPLGAELEGPDFWRGVRTFKANGLETIDAVVQPALVEDQPRRLLAALARGVPVFASAACGLSPRPGLTIIPPDDSDALTAALQSAGPA